MAFVVFFFQAEDGIRDRSPSRGLGDVYKRQFHHSFISISTPAGRSIRINESTVLGVGVCMSIRRLWVRISKCSRESLSLNGPRITQKTFFSVGRGTGPDMVAPVRSAVSTILRALLSTSSCS